MKVLNELYFDEAARNIYESSLTRKRVENTMRSAIEREKARADAAVAARREAEADIREAEAAIREAEAAIREAEADIREYEARADAAVAARRETEAAIREIEARADAAEAKNNELLKLLEANGLKPPDLEQG